MSSESVTKKKRSSEGAAPAPEGDHRKRRRNRTTQSCLNCHTSKRMCDRKRPACARCTQLGLTGLCVYEVDDPSQRIDAQDESSRLLKRVAELEGVIRELKNKPHPRWAQTANANEEFEKWQCRTPLPGTEHELCSSSSNASSPPTSSASSERGDSGLNSPQAGSMLNSPATSFTSSMRLQTGVESHRKSPYRQHSPMDTPSPALLTPTDEYPLSHVGIASSNPLSVSHDYDLASMFLSYPGLMNCTESPFSTLGDGRPDMSFAKHSGHCGCLNEQMSYNAMLELSLRLRKACDILSRSPHHHLANHCQLRQRIADLDSFTTNALADISTSPGDLSDSLLSNDRVYSNAMAYQAPRSTAGTPNGMQNVRAWELMTPNSNSPSALDDSFMTWEPSRRS